MKVLYLYQGGDSFGGQATFFSRIHPFLKNSFDFKVICHRNGPGYEYLLYNKINAIRKTLPIFPHTTQFHISFYNVKTILLLPKDLVVGLLNILFEIKKEKPDLVFIGSTGLFLCSPVARMLGYKNVVFACEIIDKGHFGIRKFLITSLLEKHADKILCVSNAVLEKFKYRTKACLLFDAVDTAVFDPDKFDKRQLRKQHDIENNSHVLGIFGGVQYAKGHDLMIDALVLLRERFPKIILLIVGAVPKKKTYMLNFLFKREISERLESVIRKNNLHDNVRFVNQTPKVAEIYSLCDLVCMPSVEEAFGDPVIEAGAMKIPVVAYARGGPLDSIYDNTTGVLFHKLCAEDLASTIINLLNNPKKMKLMGEAAREVVLKNFSYAVYVPRLKEILVNLVNY